MDHVDSGAKAKLKGSVQADWLLGAGNLTFNLTSSVLVTNMDLPSVRSELANVGAQADVRFQFLIQQPLTFSVGWAKAFQDGITRDDEWMVSLKIL